MLCCGAASLRGHPWARPVAGHRQLIGGGLLRLRPNRADRERQLPEWPRYPLYRPRALQIQELLTTGGGDPAQLLNTWHHETMLLVEPSKLPALALMPIGSIAEGLELPVQLAYLLLLVAIVGSGAFVVIRQALIRRELDESAKKLGEAIRGGEATSEEYFELGAVLLRKKLYTQATKNLEKAIKVWDGETAEIAQVHNALGYAYFNLEKNDDAIEQYVKAVELQPGYVSAWNNLGDAYEKAQDMRNAYNAYQETLAVAPDNEIAKTRSAFLKRRMGRLGVEQESEKV